MDYLTVEGVTPYDGRYEFDLRDQPLTVREWGWIKRHTGYLPLTLFDGWTASDAELMAVFAIIALVRAGKVNRDDVGQTWERFSDAPGVVTVRIELEDAEDDAPSYAARKLERERRLFWQRFDNEFGHIRTSPAGYWDAHLGFFGIPPGDLVGDLTPEQLLETALMFQAIHGSSEG